MHKFKLKIYKTLPYINYAKKKRDKKCKNSRKKALNTILKSLCQEEKKENCQNSRKKHLTLHYKDNSKKKNTQINAKNSPDTTLQKECQGKNAQI